MNMFTVLALLSALSADRQHDDDAHRLSSATRSVVMKAIGGTRRQIRARLPPHGPAPGRRPAPSSASASGLLIANAIVQFFGTSLLRDHARPSASVGSVVAASVLIGLLAPPLAALVAVTARRPGSGPRGGCRTSPSHERIDACSRSVRSAGLSFLPRQAQIGVRGVTRRGQRSLENCGSDRARGWDVARGAFPVARSDAHDWCRVGRHEV